MRNLVILSQGCRTRWREIKLTGTDTKSNCAVLLGGNGVARIHSGTDLRIRIAEMGILSLNHNSQGLAARSKCGQVEHAKSEQRDQTRTSNRAHKTPPNSTKQM